MTSGLHHVTAITRKIQANVDFYLGFLGLRLVKRTAGFEDATQLHLFYGDAGGTPGSLITFLAWEDGSPGRVGHGALSEIAFAVPRAAIGFWLTRALQFGLTAGAPSLEFGEPVLRLTDPDGIIVKLAGVEDFGGGAAWAVRGIAAEDAVLRIRSVTLLSAQPSETEAFLSLHGGYHPAAEEGTVTRLVSDAGDAIDIRDAGGFWPAAPGTGTFDHVALRMPDRASVEALAATLAGQGEEATAAHDRKYFYSLYVREPSGTLVEFATDGPGFGLDEPAAQLGERLFVPEHAALPETEIRAMLPQFGLPGEPRIVYRDLPFIHRINEAEAADGSALFLLHGSGGSEASLMPLGRQVASQASLIGVRGRSTEEGNLRYFRRFADGSFDQDDIRAEAEAFAAFLEGAIAAYGLQPDQTAFLGYSNGANMLAATMQLQPGLVRRAVLIRPMPVLAEPPEVALAGHEILVVTGRTDPFAARSAELAAQLRAAGASVTEVTVDAGHDLAAADAEIAATWLRERSL